MEMEMHVFSNLDVIAKFLLSALLSQSILAGHEGELGRFLLLITSHISVQVKIYYPYIFSVDFPSCFWSILNTITVPVFALSADGTIVHWNKSMEEFTQVVQHHVFVQKLAYLAIVYIHFILQKVHD